MEDNIIEVNVKFKQYSFEQDKTDCKRCNPGRWLVVANYECIYFPAIGQTYNGIEVSPIKIIVASYKNLKDAKQALHNGRIRRREVEFNHESP